MKLAVIGTGYVGLVTGTCFASIGNKVMCVDFDQEKLRQLKKGKVVIYEPELEDIFAENVKTGDLVFSDSLKEATDFADIIFLSLPTPPKQDGSADIKYVLQVAEELGNFINSYKIIVTKSTVPVGTADLVKRNIAKHSKSDFDVVSNPEFLREGHAVADFLKPERVVIGANSQRAASLMKELYLPIVSREEQVILMDIRSAELTKYAANSFLATKISFINEVSNLCDKVGADVKLVAKGIGSDSRIGFKFLEAGLGYGGSCFPKDVSALYKTGHQHNYPLEILDAVMRINYRQKGYFVEKIKEYYDNNLKGKKITVWGLAFKADTDDIRETPAVEIISALQSAGAKITAYDPQATENFKKFTEVKNINYSKDKYESLEKSDALVIVTDWKEFRTADLNQVAKTIKDKVIFDGRNLFTPSFVKEYGLTYVCLGRNG